MKLSQVLPVATILTIGFASQAIAGSSVSNTRTHRVTKGTGSVVTNFHRQASGVQINRSNGLKIDAEGGDVNVVNLKFDGHKFTGSGHSSNNNPTDPFVAGVSTSQFEKVRFNETLNQRAVENYKFRETTNDLTVTSDAI
jgi:hypothetical protein